MSISNLKIKFIDRQKRKTKLWLVDDTRYALTNARREGAVQNGTDPSSVKPPDQTTVSIYHAALMSDPKHML